MTLPRYVSTATGRRCIALAALLGVLAVPVRAADVDTGERSRIAAERRAIESRYAARERECRERFVVTSCVDDAKRDRRKGLDALRARQLQLDEERRHERTAARRAELAGKAAEDARRDQERGARAASAPASRRDAPRTLEPRRPEPGASAPGAPRAGLDRPGAAGQRRAAKAPAESAEQRREREARRRASYEARQQQAAEHRREVMEKTASRLKSRGAAAPLPVPASAPPR